MFELSRNVRGNFPRPQGVGFPRNYAKGIFRIIFAFYSIIRVFSMSDTLPFRQGRALTFKRNRVMYYKCSNFDNHDASPLKLKASSSRARI